MTTDNIRKVSNAKEDDNTAPSDVEMGELSELIGFYLRITQTLSYRALVREAGETENTVKVGYFSLLTLISHNPGISQTLLSRTNGRDKSSLTLVIDELERNKLLTRRRMEGNRRTYALHLTPAGERARRSLLKAAVRSNQYMRSVLGEKNSDEFLRMLKLLAATLAADTAGSAVTPTPAKASGSPKKRVR